MPVVLILRGRADGKATPFDGAYLKAFDFEALDGRGMITMTDKASDAKQFRNGMEAFDYIQTVPKVKPIREDGQPNRPLTATNWEYHVTGY